jgi:hypothetical protein
MSGRLVSAVFDSALPAWLKPYAAACATFAEDDGTRVYPSIARVARMVGRCERATQTALQDLRRRGVLIIAVEAGRHRARRYVFNARALPTIEDADQLPLFPQATKGKPARIDVFHSHAQASTGSGLHVMGAVGRTRSVNDPSSIQLFGRARKGKYQKTGSEP